MPSALVSQTAQGAVLSITSNIIAQVITSYKENTPFELSLSPILKFAIFSILSNPPNILWQTYLERQFPNNPPPSPSEKKLKDKPVVEPTQQMSKRNVLIKFILDQTVGAVMNTLMFCVFMGCISESASASASAAGQGKKGAWGSVEKEVKDKFYPMIMDGYKFWPMVSLVGFLWVPVDKRVVFGCSVGVLWGIYLSLLVDG